MISKKGEHVLEFDELKHRYKLDGQAVPGTTTFTKSGYPTSELLTSWMVGQGAQYVWDNAVLRQKNDWTDGEMRDILKAAKIAYRAKAEEAAGIGTIVHDYAYFIEVGKPQDAQDLLYKHRDHPKYAEISNGVTKFEDWHEQNKGETVLLEAIVASIKHSYAGKFDHLSFRNGLLILSDYKTSNGIYVDQFIQLAAYAVAIEEWLDEWLKEYNLPLEIGGLEILRFGKERGEYQPLLIDNKIEIRYLKEQAIRCRETYKFRLKWEADRRFKFNGGANAKGGDSKTEE